MEDKLSKTETYNSLCLTDIYNATFWKMKFIFMTTIVTLSETITMQQQTVKLPTHSRNPVIAKIIEVVKRLNSHLLYVAVII